MRLDTFATFPGGFLCERERVSKFYIMSDQNPTETAPSETSSSPAAPPAVTPANPETPPAAKVVVEGTKTERELRLERDLKVRETRLAELEDENRQLKTLPKPPGPPPAREKSSWLSGATFFED